MHIRDTAVDKETQFLHPFDIISMKAKDIQTNVFFSKQILISFILCNARCSKSFRRM